MLQKFPQKFGPYVLLAPLGAGGMGAVFLAMSGHREMETLCVVKRMLPALLPYPEHVRRFRHEADLARQLVHSNLAHTHNIGEVDEEVFLVQEFVEGHDVSALLDRMAVQGRTLPVPVAIHIVSEIARGLSYAHDFENLNLVHRDINPPNVRLTYAGEVKLLDFGIASSDLHGELSGEHRAAGKLWHLAPEQLQAGAKLDRRTDIYALGVLLWELLTQKPVGATVAGRTEPRPEPETEGEILMWITRADHAVPSKFNPDVSPQLDAIVRKATSLSPDDRFETADDFRRALAAFVPLEVHPELWLSIALKEIFSPEAERAERRRLVESARHLLDVGPDRRASRTLTSPSLAVSASTAALAELSRRRPPRRRWLLPVGVGGLAGLATLLWLHLSADRAGDNRVGDIAAPASVHAVAPAPLPAAPTISPPSPQAASAEVTPSASPTAAPAALAKDPAKPRAVTANKHSDGVVSIPPKAGQKPDSAADHLAAAREAFNARDWNRALGEGKSAVAAGGGADALALVGNTYFKMGKFGDAQEQYEKALALDPGNTLLKDRVGIAQARVRQGKTAQEP